MSDQQLKNIQTISQEQLAIKRLDIYLGSSEKQKDQNGQIYQTSTQQIFTEIIQNAYDNFIRSGKPKDYVIDVLLQARRFIIKNNGGVFEIKNQEQDLKKLQDVFYKPNTSSHYTTDKQKISAGMNGLGAKLCNYVSQDFTITNQYNNIQYKIQWKTNKNLLDKIITQNVKQINSENYFQVQLTLAQDQIVDIGQKIQQKIHFEDFNQNMILKYIQELVNLGLNINFNGKRISQKPFEQIYNLQNFTKDHLISNKFDLYFIINTEISFCMLNGIYSENGSFLRNIKNSLKNGRTIPKLHCIVYGECQDIKYNEQIKITADLDIQFQFQNPKKPSMDQFSEQTNEFVNSLVQVKVQRKAMNNIEKLTEAVMSSKDPKSLILTEGDSAKSMFDRLNTVFHKHNKKAFFYDNGLFPLRGKVLNIRKKSQESNELNIIMKATGLNKNQHYSQDEIQQLRYQKIIIASDFDEDGYHIKCLLINFFLTYWPELIHYGYLQEFITPIVGIKINNQKQFYYSLNDIPKNIPKNTQIKYYKGLSTLEDEDLLMIAQNINHHIKTIIQNNETKDEEIQNSLKDLFETQSSMRKQLILDFQQQIIDYNKPDICIKEDLNQFVEYGYVTQNRAIPSEIDGFKDSQRKIMYYVLKNLTKSLKVAQLSGYVSAEMDYHHGETSLDGAIIKLAQNFTGSNNIALLEGQGSFGTRMDPQSFGASRYIYVEKPNILKYIFRQEDEIIYKFNDLQQEPINLYPIIPIHLVNGTLGIGTGFSTLIYAYNPLQIIQFIINNLKNIENKEVLIPWYKNYQGKISKSQNGKIKVEGNIQEFNDYVLVNDVVITTCVSDLISDLKKEGIQGDIELLGDTKIKFSLKNKNQQIWDKVKKSYLETEFNTNNMTVLKNNQIPVQYKDIHVILKDWCKIRVQFYFERKQKLINKLSLDFVEQFNIDLFVKNQDYKLIQQPNFDKVLQKYMTTNQLQTFQVKEFNKVEELVEQIKEFMKNNCTGNVGANTNTIEQDYKYILLKSLQFYKKWQGIDLLKQKLQQLIDKDAKQLFIDELLELKKYIV